MARIVKIVELMGVSEESFTDAVRAAVKEAAKTIRNITGVEVIKSTAQVEVDEIIEYHVTVTLAFASQRGRSADASGESDEPESDEATADEADLDEADSDEAA